MAAVLPSVGRAVSRGTGRAGRPERPRAQEPRTWPYRPAPRVTAPASRCVTAGGQARADFIAAARGEARATANGRTPAGLTPQPGRLPVVPRQLPGVVACFTGRDAELAALTGLLDAQPGARARPGWVSAVAGTAGVGKTALAVYWAHEVAERFPDGQLYVNLRGYDPSGTPVPPDEAICGFLDALEVPAGRIPPSLEARSGLYRSLLSGRQMLIVLDNAANAAQVRPLLPGSAGCLVVITSRNQLAGLATAEGAQLLTLDVLTEAEARQLLAGRLGVARLGAEPEAADELVASCARLPLALAITAARAAVRPGFRLAALAAELRDTAGRSHTRRRRSGGQHPSRVLLVLPATQHGRGADVPAAGPAPRPRHTPPRPPPA